ncbi:SubName: Full=Uncharacterized protein {ECO:0000313/EMBL:CCA77866.1} [Serendipita indica DSM 11827]|uniref:Uncharacterized protein n=1 Tax=Serendipita indica (strain DSM 11827) TaxID=1109443 RepID=G4U2T6_SERID|nr:SubName: Full=Uncharacterized protein {ECO:0000313/EMBL:CCA77866.1} [Serendipita indica DSM 11827]CCA77866.1 hypothetical protein PIIN_00512 [Serendipita indica DSM 11827]
MSQLEILKEYFHRLEMDNRDSAYKVCSYFNFIVGSGGGGVIAILLGVLGMELDQASRAFGQICRATLLGEARTLAPEERTRRLEQVFKDILAELQVPEDRRLNSDVDLADGCKVAIAYQSAAQLGQCKLFRNYDSRHRSHNPTILQAMLAAWATPGLFSSTKVTTDIAYEEVVSAASGYSNPIFQAIREAYEGYGPTQLVSCILSLGSGSHVLRIPEKGYKAMVARYARDAALTADDAQRRLGGSGKYFRLSVTPAIEDDLITEDNPLGVIASGTSSYLSLSHQDQLVDTCLNMATMKGGVDLEALAQVRTEMTASTHGLPPLSPFFVRRQEPTVRIFEGVVRGRTLGQTVMVISGLGGSGKTQLCIQFALQYGDLFQHVLFIDASSAKSIEDGLLARVGSVIPSFRGIDFRDAMDMLENPNSKLTARWLIIFDNADDDSVSIQDYMPNCRHGSIIITTRNPSLGSLAPETHLVLDVMSGEEATNALLSSALAATEERTPRHKEMASKIVEQLGNLPVAVVQAGCYIKKQRCFWDYLTRLNANRTKLLRHITIQRDKLKYNHGAYNAFDTTLRVLSLRALNLLSILSCMHFTNIPRELFILAATYRFEYQPFDLAPRSDEFHQSVSLLQETLSPSQDPRLYESDLEEVLDELYQYSLVSFVPVHSWITIRLHPLLHSWAGDRLTAQERGMFRAVTARLLASCTNDVDSHIRTHISPHVTALMPFMADLHINERAALCRSIREDGKYTLLVSTWEAIHAEVEKAYGDKDMRTSTAALELADAYGQNGDTPKMEEMERALVASRSAMHGSESLEAMGALLNLARTLAYYKSEYKEGEEAARKTLEVRRRILGRNHLDIYESLYTLGSIQRLNKQYSEAVATFLEAVAMSTTLLGRDHRQTFNALRMLAACYEGQKNPDARTIMQDLYDTREKVLGPKHPETLTSLHQLGESCYNIGDTAQAEEFFRRELRIRRESDGPQSTTTITAIHWLGCALYQQENYSEAEEFFREEAIARSARGLDSMNAKFWLAATIFLQRQESKEAEQLFREYTNHFKEAHPEPHANVSDGLYWTGRSMLAQAEYAEAVSLFEESISMWSQLGSENNANAVHAKQLLKKAQQRLKQSQEVSSA